MVHCSNSTTQHPISVDFSLTNTLKPWIGSAKKVFWPFEGVKEVLKPSSLVAFNGKISVWNMQLTRQKERTILAKALNQSRSVLLLNK